MPESPPREASVVRCPVQLDDVNLFGTGAQEYWYQAYDILHSEAPVQRIPGEGFLPGTDGFILSRYEDVARVVKDENRYPPLLSLILNRMIDAGVDPASQPQINAMMASMFTLRPDPESWRSHRQELTDPWVGSGARRHEAMITRTATALIDDWIQRDELEFVSEFAQPLPQRVMAEVLGWPLEDLKLLKRFGDATVKAFVYGKGHRSVLDRAEMESQLAVLGEFNNYTNDLIREKRRQPREDMISFLTQANYSPINRKLNDLEINGIVYAMVIGGLETTQYALAEQIQLLIEEDGIWETLKEDRGQIRPFTEEAMRLRSPTQGLSTRTTSEDEVFQGVAVPQGSLLHLRWAAANIDPQEWDDAKSLKLDRKAGTRHLAFSQGARVCPGASLSRLEQTIAWNVLLDRVGHFSYAEKNTFEHQPGIMLGTLALNLSFNRV